MQKAPRPAGEDAEHGPDPRKVERQSIWNSLAATWLAIVLAGLLLVVAGAIHRWMQDDRGDGPTSILR